MTSSVTLKRHTDPFRKNTLNIKRFILNASVDSKHTLDSKQSPGTSVLENQGQSIVNRKKRLVTGS